jgi:type II secretory pathway component GspD/PulD (secretin)
MRICTSLVLIATYIALVPNVAQAQQPPGPFESASPASALLGQPSVQKELKLDDDQVNKVQELRLNHIRKVVEASKERKEKGFDLKEQEKKRHELYEENDKAVAQILRPEQAKRLKQISYQRLGFRALDDPEVAKAIGLTDEQKKNIEQIKSERLKQFSALPGNFRDEEHRKKAIEFAKNSNDRITKVLTDEQNKKWKELQGEPFKGEIRRLSPSGDPIPETGGITSGDGSGFGGGPARSAQPAQPASTRERPNAEPKRGAYVVKYAAAKSLADILAKHFKGAAEIQAGPKGTSNCLLINAPPPVFDEVMKTLDQLDRRPHSVALEVFVVELPRKKADDKDKGPDEKEFSGTIDEVAKRLDGMMKKGQVAGFQQIKLSTLEGELGSLSLSENKPFATGPNSTIYVNVGTQVIVTPQVMVDGSITLDLRVRDNRGRDSTTEGGKPEFITTSLMGKISVASGKAVLAKDAKVTSKEGQGETLIIVGAQVATSEAAAKKEQRLLP